MNPDRARWLRQRRVDDVERRRSQLSPIVAGERSFYRPGEILIDLEAERSYGRLLESRYGGKQYRPGGDRDWRAAVRTRGQSLKSPDLNGRLAAAKVPVRLWTLDTATAASNLVAELRKENSGRVGISVNQVFFGEPRYQGGPGGPPAPCQELKLEPFPASPLSAGVHLSVLDTGVPLDWPTMHSQLVGGLQPDADDIDELDDDCDGKLDTFAGHGLFICGLVHQLYPGLRVDPGLVLDSTGVGDDASIALELSENSAPVINLSLGGYTEDNNPPPALQAAITALGPDVVVVAAAGNNSSTDPFWPAALDGVIAVGAYDSTQEAGPVQADFSNSGTWVDVCAPGVDLASTYVIGTWQDHDGPRQFDRWATWSGTSFAAPLVATEIARRIVVGNGAQTPSQVAADFLAGLPASPWAGMGKLYEPPVDLTA